MRVELAVMALLAAGPSFVLSLEGLADPATIDLEIGALELIASVLAALGPAAVALYLLWRDGRLEAAGFARRPAAFIAGYGLLGWVCCFIGLLMVGLLINSIVLATGGDIEDSAGDSAAVELTGGVVLVALVLSVTAGFAEEIVFRAYAISRMEEAGFGRAAIWAPWAVFTVVHLYQGLIALLVIGVVAGVFVWLFRWKRSVWPVMVAHFLYDMTILLLVASTS